MENKLYYRDGREFTGKQEQNDKGKPVTYRQTKCSRCGGAGGAEKWRHTGWTCFQCGGSGLGPVVTDRLYTAEQLQKLNATRDKREAKKAAAQAAKTAALEAAHAALEAARASNRAEFKQAHKELFDAVWSLNDDFLITMVGQCIERTSISDKQIELINAKLAAAKTKASSQHLGTVGERRDFTCKIERILNWSRQQYPHFSKYCHIMRDENGNCVKYIGSSNLGAENETVTFKATVTEHTDYNGEKQTVVARPKLVDVVQETGTKGSAEEPWK
jgi:hypothetical protein